MPPLATAVFGVVVIAYVAGARPLERWHITAPMVFMIGGTVAGLTISGIENAHVVHDLAELTLALILFHDAAQVRPRQLEREAGVCARLLFLGLPLTIAAGFVVAEWLTPAVGVPLALLLAASLAPTDAGLGAATVLNPVVPVRIRRVLNVESGLNDGLCTPVVLFAIAAASAESDQQHVSAARAVAEALLEIGAGVLVGVVLGAGCGWLLAQVRRWGEASSAPIAIASLAVPLVCYYGSVLAHGNGFVAAFVAGMAFTAAFAPGQRRPSEPTTAGRVRGPLAAVPTGQPPADPQARNDAENALVLTERVSTLLGYAVWALFGVVGVARLGDLLTWQGVAYALLSLTVLRMVPVALALIGSRFTWRTVLFIGWFGPRGLASVIFALIALETLPLTPELGTVLGAITVTVVLSVVLHGMTADPWAQRYGRWVETARPAEELRSASEPSPGRGRPPRRDD